MLPSGLAHAAPQVLTTLALQARKPLSKPLALPLILRAQSSSQVSPLIRKWPSALLRSEPSTTVMASALRTVT